ncbi:hypothetical protein M8C21_029015 [Ambrosia artemisiifolia]|uniref:Uncharacterized protein n=1 Tax=Ambrosia artemisiifolia TaxID=4212 RepID=A0AAD5CTI9_AMBAR|nr:hypothetical protein M8C21_029015 [Ambrosia artemisiifolia]
MEKTEPTFVPEWLKSSAGSSAASQQLTSSSSHSGELGVLKSGRNKLVDKDLDRTSSLDRERDRDRDKDIFEFRNKGRSESRRHDYSDPLGNILPSRFEKNGLRRSHSSLPGKRGEPWPTKVASDLSIVKKDNHNNCGSLVSGNVKSSFERDFPSLGADEKHVDNDIGRVSSPGLSSVIQSLPIGNSAVIGGDGWTSALAEVPVIVGSNANGSSVAPPVPPAPVSATTSMPGGRNMAETLAHGPPRTQTPPQLTVGTQRLEELAVKQSRQLIPMTPSMPKSLALNSSDKQKLKIGQSQFQSSHLMNNNPTTPRSATVKPDVSKTSNVGKLLILKPSRERNGMAPTAKDSLSPTGGGNKLPNSPLAVPSAVGTAPLKKSGNGTVANLEKRPSLQAQSRSNFFNLMRKKSMTSSNASSVASDTSSSNEPSENHGEPVASEGGPGSPVVQQPSESMVDVTCNGDTCGEVGRSTVNGKNHSGPDVILYSEEEEARFLRSLGWEETAEEEEGLTEEEISSFLQNIQSYLMYISYRRTHADMDVLFDNNFAVPDFKAGFKNIEGGTAEAIDANGGGFFKGLLRLSCA